MAAALDDAEAELNLARMYSTGHGVPRDDVEAAKWLRRAADQGRVVAQTVLAAMYIAGRGVVKSDTEAVTWERKAADQGYAAAQSMLGSAY
jgi:TPR repeat protein